MSFREKNDMQTHAFLQSTEALFIL